MKQFNTKNKIFFQTKKLNNYILYLKYKKKKKWNVIKKANRCFLKKRFKKKKYFYKYKYKIFLKKIKVKKFINKLFLNFLIKKIIKKNKINFKKIIFLIFKRRFDLKKLLIYIYSKNKVKNINNFLKKIKIRKKKYYSGILKKFFIFLKYKKKNSSLFLKNKILFFKNKKKKKFFNIKNKLLLYQNNNQEFFKTGLHIKQILKKNYNITTSQSFKKIFKIFLKTRNEYNNLNFFSFLDSKIDNCLVSSGIAETVEHAGLLIKHKKIKINNKVINSKLYFLKPGDFYFCQNNKIITKKNNINIVYNFIFKNFIFIKYKNLNELTYNFNLDYNLIIYLLKIGKL